MYQLFIGIPLQNITNHSKQPGSCCVRVVSGKNQGFGYSDGEVGSPASEFCPQGSSKHFCSSFSSFFDRSLLRSSSGAHHSVCEQPESEFCLIFVSGTVMRQHPL